MPIVAPQDDAKETLHAEFGHTTISRLLTILQKKKVFWIILLSCVAGAVFLLSHRSGKGQVFNRFSIKYALFLFGYFSCSLTIIGLLIFNRPIRNLTRTFSLSDASLRLKKVLSRYSKLLIFITIVYHISGLFFIFPPNVILSKQPISNVDYSYHYNQFSGFVSSMDEFGKPWAYDPSFCAGYPQNTLNDVDLKLLEITGYLFCKAGLPKELSFNISIFILCSLIPLLILLACRNFGFSRLVTLAILAGTVALVQSNNQIGFFIRVGMCMFVVASYWSIFFVSQMYQYLKRPTLLRWCCITLSGTIGLMIHCTTPILVAPSLLALLLYHAKQRPYASYLLLFASCVIILAINSWWLIPLLQFLPYRVDTPFMKTFSVSQMMWVFFNLADADVMVSVLGLLGFFLERKKNRLLAYGGMAPIFMFFIIGNLGSELPFFKMLEPSRFFTPLVLWSAIGTIIGIASLISSKKTSFSQSEFYPWMLVFGIIYSIHFLMPNWTRRGLTLDNPDVISPIIEWISKNTSTSARIAFLENSPGFFSGSRIRNAINRQLIGGPFSHMNLQHAFASFTSDRFFGKQLNELTPDYFLEYCVRYNIRWIIITVPDCAVRFEKFQHLAKKTSVINVQPFQNMEKYRFNNPFLTLKNLDFPVTILEIDTVSSFFERGSGTVTARQNSISVTDASLGSIVLKYHWLDMFQTEPPLPIRKFEIPGDSIGFIEVDNGNCSNFTIYNSYKKRK